MNPDDGIRAALGALRRAPAPPVPALPAAVPEPPRPRAAVAAVAAAIVLGAVAVGLWMPAKPSLDAAGPLTARIEALEARIGRVAHEELRSLLGRELALLRRELELARSAP